MWEFEEIREAVIQKIFESEIDLVEKIALARDHHIKDWLLPCLDAYTRRGESITAGDVNILGLDFVLKIVHVREMVVHSQSHPDCVMGVTPHNTVSYSNIENRHNHDFTEALHSVFLEEIKQMERFNGERREKAFQEEDIGQVGYGDDDPFYPSDVIFLVSGLSLPVEKIKRSLSTG
jgi:hypothetical protein